MTTITMNPNGSASLPPMPPVSHPAGPASDAVGAVSASAGSVPAPRPNAPAGVVYETDAKGRRIGVKRLSVPAELRFLKLFGGENYSYYSLCIKLGSVCEINGDPIAPPNTELELEALAQRLGREGIVAVDRAHAALAEAEEVNKEVAGK